MKKARALFLSALLTTLFNSLGAVTYSKDNLPPDSQPNSSEGHKSAGELFFTANTAYRAAYYPSAISRLETLLDNYPDNPYSVAALFMLGDSYLALDYSAKAESAFLACQNKISTHSGKNTNYFQVSYLLACAQKALGKFDLALKNFHDYSTYYKAVEKSQIWTLKTALTYSAPLGKERATLYYRRSIASMGEIYYNKSSYKKAIPFLTAAAAWDETCRLQLLSSLCNLGDPKGALTFFDKYYSNYDEKKSDKTNYCAALLLKAKAHEIQNDRDLAIKTYCQVLSKGSDDQKSTALKALYTLYTAGDRGRERDFLGNLTAGNDEIFSQLGKISDNGGETLALNNSLISQFWARLGCDYFKAARYDEALKCLDRAESGADLKAFLAASLLRAQIVAGRPPSKASSQAAIDIINMSRSILNPDNENLLFREANILLGRYYYITGDEKKFLECARAITPLPLETREQLGRIYFSRRDYGAVIDLLKEFNKEITSEGSLILAKSFILTGDKDSGLKVYKTLFDMKKLKTQDIYDYCVTLIQTGDYKSALAASSASLDSSNGEYKNRLGYIKALSLVFLDLKGLDTPALDDPERLSQIKDLFSSYYNDKNIKDERTLSYALFFWGYGLWREKNYNEAYLTLLNFCASYPKHQYYYYAQFLCAQSIKLLGEPALSLDHAKDTLGTQESNLKSAALYFIASTLQEMGDHKGAISKFKELLKYFSSTNDNNDERLFEIYTKIEESYKAQGNDARAALFHDLAKSHITETKDE